MKRLRKRDLTNDDLVRLWWQQSNWHRRRIALACTREEARYEQERERWCKDALREVLAIRKTQRMAQREAFLGGGARVDGVRS